MHNSLFVGYPSSDAVDPIQPPRPLIKSIRVRAEDGWQVVVNPRQSHKIWSCELGPNWRTPVKERPTAYTLASELFQGSIKRVYHFATFKTHTLAAEGSCLAFRKAAHRTAEVGICFLDVPGPR